MVKHDPSLPFMRLVGKNSDLVAFFNNNVLSVAWPDYRATTVDRVNVDWTPGRKYAAVLEMQIEGPDETPPLRAVMSFDKDEQELADLYARHYSSPPEISNDGPLPALFLPNFQCLVEFFPWDWGIPGLARAASPDEMLPCLSAASADDVEPTLWHCQVSVLRYKPHERCTLLYALQSRDSDDRRELIGKLYGDATAAANAFSNHHRLHAAAQHQELTIPQPLRFIEELNLVLMERVRGPTMASLLRQGKEPSRMMRKAASALSTFHRLPVEGRDVRSLHSQLTRIRRKANSLHLIAPEQARPVRALLDRIERFCHRLECTRFGLVHGAWRAEHLIVADGTIFPIDFDGVSRGDPALDVGSFMSKCLTKEQMSGADAASELAELFLAEYQVGAGADGGLADRARVHCALFLTWRAVRGFLRAHQDKHRDNYRPNLFLEGAAAWLDRVK